ncbi:MAG: hydroxyacid dehydrogenase, partial [Flavobacteriales bacterium]|nr:hydroxyacid dehydrogenase [Flavobacteriales bacterium]
MRILFIDTVHESLWNRLSSASFSCVDGTKWTQAQIFDVLDQFAGIVIRSRFAIDATFLAKASRLQFIARSGSGLENIDLPAANAKGIIVFSAPEGNRRAVAEHAVGMLLSMFNNLNRCDREVRDGIWRREENRGTELSSKTVGIIGFGQNGSAFGQVLQGFGCEVLAYDKYKSDYTPKGVNECSLEVLQKRCDVLSFHVPQNEETIHYVDQDFIDSVHRPFYLVNTSRGKIVDTGALADGIRSGKIKGACLDVLEYEKSSFEMLKVAEMPDELKFILNSEKVLISPHVAGWTFES